MKIDWKRKLTSQKLWVSVGGFVAGLVIIFGGSQDNADKISGSGNERSGSNRLCSRRGLDRRCQYQKG